GTQNPSQTELVLFRLLSRSFHLNQTRLIIVFRPQPRFLPSTLSPHFRTSPTPDICTPTNPQSLNQSMSTRKSNKDPLYPITDPEEILRAARRRARLDATLATATLIAVPSPSPPPPRATAPSPSTLPAPTGPRCRTRTIA
ncbi:hypothetical protein PTTG_10879, partial [Puccinia triticina 1-1 BBBD Race 1]|uniref:Uncharacterized protein n=1 Tax=Puccinia triticina (isolate 1-1 / race 1 (BBBD)) TaxID=630390 RepID=A0A0C4FCC7_PUCT1